MNVACTSTEAAATHGLSIVVTDGNGYRWTGVLPDGALAPKLVDDKGNVQDLAMNTHGGFTQFLTDAPTKLEFRQRTAQRRASRYTSPRWPR